MLEYIKLMVTVALVVVNSAFCSIAICLLALIKMITPTENAKRLVSLSANQLMWLWATLNSLILTLFSRIEWQIEGVEQLDKSSWYLMISNHQSWSDIVVLCCVFKDKIPMPKFFLKQQLLYVPFVGMACWALDMPFMKRYSREYLIRHPHLKGKDLETTRRSCEKFKFTPTTVVNYVEGTRFTKEKQHQSRGKYQHLLPPKSGGIAYTLATMGEQFDAILDVTIAYPENRTSPFSDLLMGKMKRIVVKVNVLPVDQSVKGDYFNDKPYKRAFQQWLSERWQEKDGELEKLYQE